MSQFSFQTSVPLQSELGNQYYEVISRVFLRCLVIILFVDIGIFSIGFTLKNTVFYVPLEI